MVVVISIDGIIYLEFIKLSGHDHNDETTRLLFVLYLLPAVLEAVFSLILAISACLIANWVTQSTDKKQNTCLLAWHLINLFLLVASTTLYATFYYKQSSVKYESADYFRYSYYEMIAKLAKLNTDYYVNLFLLWLLYRFMKPEKKLKDG